MLVGKRPGPPLMRRTTSMSGGMAVETMQTSSNEQVMCDSHVDVDDDAANSIIKDPHVVPMNEFMVPHQHDHTKINGSHESKVSSYEYVDDHHQRLMMMDMVMPLSPTTTINHLHHHRHTHNHTNTTNIHTSHFLHTCGLCNSALTPGRDIYMYRGDTAFCSLECREKKMKQDQRKEKWKSGRSNKEHHRESQPGAAAKASTKSETAACT